MVETLSHAHSAFQQRAWGTCYAALADADRVEVLAGDDVEMYAMAAFLAGHSTESVELWTRAHAQYLSAGNVSRAAHCAIRVGMDLLNAGERVRGASWLDKARRLLEGHTGECVEAGYLMLPEAIRRIAEGDASGAGEVFERAAEIGRRFRDQDLTIVARQGLGRALVRSGRIREGCALLDEAMVAVEAGEVSPIFAGQIYCSVIEASLEIFDVRRAREWTSALAQWCGSQPDLVPYTGQCLVRRAEIMQLHGEWSAAAEAAQSACERFLSGPPQRATAAAFYQHGELQRLRGDYADAEESYREAARRGLHPQPGMALMRMAQGQVDAAASGIRSALEQAKTPSGRCRILPAFVAIMLGAKDVVAAREAAEELSQLSVAMDAPFVRAAADQAMGAVALASGDARAALNALRAASSGWQDLEAPYETAQTRALIGLALRALGDADAANMELDAAGWTFEQLSAGPDLARLREQTRTERRTSSLLTEREHQVLRLVAGGHTNRAIAAKLRISEKTVARHVSNIFTKLHVSTRAAATAYAFKQGLA